MPSNSRLVGAIALGLAVAACSALGDDGDTTSSDFSIPHGRGPGSGRRPIGPEIADDDAGDAAPAATLAATDDAGDAAPADDAGDAGPVDPPPADPPPPTDDAGM